MTELTEFAAAFARKIVDGDTDSAHAMLTGALAQATTAAELSSQFETLADDMGGVTGVGEPMVILEEWPDMAADDRAMLYVPLEGDVFSEAFTVTIAAGENGLRISNIEWGRP
jgi:hypothetical protein